MKVTVKFTYNQYKEVGNSLRRVLNYISENQEDYSDSPVEYISLIEGLEHIIKKIINRLMQPISKKYSLSLNNFEAWVLVNACQNYTFETYELVLISEIVDATYNESLRLINHRQNLRGNLNMKQLN